MTNLLYGSQYLYRLVSGSSSLGVDDDALHWAILTSDSGSIVNFWFEKDGGTTAGQPVLTGDTIYIAMNSTPDGATTRYLGVDARKYARWDLVAGLVKAKWQLQSPGIAAGQAIPIYAQLTVGFDEGGTLSQATDGDYLQVGGSSPLTFMSADT